MLIAPSITKDSSFQNSKKSYLNSPLLLLSFLFLMVLAASLLPSISYAHPLAPALLKIDLLSKTQAKVLWKESSSRASSVNLAPVFPSDCRKEDAPVISSVGTGVLYQWEIRCVESLIGKTIMIDGLGQVDATVLVDYGDVEDARTSSLLNQHATNFTVPISLSSQQVIQEYGLSGVMHLMLGWDHILFVLGLFVLLYQRRKTLLLAITAFTLGHSMTLVLVVIGLLPAAGVWIEIFIALSITFLALEILNPNVVWFGFSIKKSPYLLTFVFGLVHGCGFASLLSEMLSNSSTKLLPLVSFNIGIEIGQCIMLLLFAAVATTLNKLFLGSSSLKLSQWKLPAVGYGLGVMSVYWLILRSAEL